MERTCLCVLIVSRSVATSVVFVVWPCTLQSQDIFQMAQLLVSLPIMMNAALVWATVIPPLHPKEEEGVDISNSRGLGRQQKRN
jgi:hypothetical protein